MIERTQRSAWAANWDFVGRHPPVSLVDEVLKIYATSQPGLQRSMYGQWNPKHNPIDHMKPWVTRAKLEKNRLEFIKAELDLGFTFATIARSAHDADKFERNKRNALRAYDEANRFLQGVSLSVEDREQFEVGIDMLRSALRACIFWGANLRP